MWFGPESWGAPVNETNPRVPIPVGEPCGQCGELVGEDDCGFTFMLMGSCEPGGPKEQEVAQHRECFMLEIFGHANGVCPCTSYPLEDRRAAGREVLRRMAELGQHHWGPA